MYSMPELSENRRSPQQRMEDEMLIRNHMQRKQSMMDANNQDRIERDKLIKGQPHSVAYMTDQEMEAMNQLRNEPGLRGRLARKGAKKKMDFVGGIPAFFNPSANYTDDTNTTVSRTGGGGGYNTSIGNLYNDNDSSSGGGGGDGGGSVDRSAQIQAEFDKYKAGEDARNKEAAEKRLTEYKGERRQELTDEFGDYKSRYKNLEDQYDVSSERQSMKDLAGEARGLGTRFGETMSGISGDVKGYQGDVAGLRGDVKTLRDQQAGLGGKIGGLAEQALDPSKSTTYDRNRRMLSGMAEQQRNASNLAAQEQLNRGAASTGMSPEKLALAQAQLKQGQGAQARQDALSSAMGAQQMTGQQLAQGAGLYGQQAGLGMQQASLLGQQAGLGAQAAGMAGQRGAMAGQAAGFQSGILGQRGGFQGQSANLLNQQLMGKSNLMNQQVGMTEYQLQDVVAQQNQDFEREMGEKGFAYQRDAANAMRPRSPSTMDQLTGLATAVAPMAIAAFSDKTLKKNVRKAKDEDLMKPKEIDGFLNSLYAKQYNYKDPKHGHGKQVGIMAQDVEKTQLGKQMVEETSEGKQINAAKGLGLVMASQARLNERLNSIGA